MKVCFVCNEYPPGPHGGIGTFTQVLGRALVRAGHEVRVVGHYSPNYPGPDYEEDQGVRVWRLRGPTSRGRWIWARYRLFRYIARWAKAGEIDLVEVPDYQGWAAFWPRLEVPVVARVHSSTMYNASRIGKPISRRDFWLTRQSLCRADFWAAVSQYAADRAKQFFLLPSPSQAILYNPVEMIAASHQPYNRNLVVFAGTLNQNKGVISLVKAWTQVIAQYPAAELHLFGKDSTYHGCSMREHLTLLLPAGIRPSVIFHGHMPRENLFGAFKLARAAVFPSYSEAFAIVPFEAMACGCPTIYTKHPPGPELVEDGVNGLLVDPDNPDEIADAILRLLQDDNLARRLGEAGRKLVQEKYSVEAVLPQNIRFYEECIANFQATRKR
ncbi:MAG: glycosyltransferase family 4 protein [Chloroflexota bacterium]|jgi:glycosyltransferase involved in cell wall biosynthesis